MHGDQCEYCEGTIQEQVLDRLVLMTSKGPVILEHVPVGECDHCYHKYYSASVLRLANDVAGGGRTPRRLEKVPVADYAQSNNGSPNGAKRSKLPGRGRSLKRQAPSAKATRKKATYRRR